MTDPTTVLISVATFISLCIGIINAVINLRRERKAAIARKQAEQEASDLAPIKKDSAVVKSVDEALQVMQVALKQAYSDAVRMRERVELLEKKLEEKDLRIELLERDLDKKDGQIRELEDRVKHIERDQFK